MRYLINIILAGAMLLAGLATIATGANESPNKLNSSERTRAEARTIPVSAKKKAASKASRVASFAKSQAGKRYCRGGNGPNCWDCSGLTTKAYKRVGISLPRVAADQRRSSKTVHVSRYKARAGDLVFWGYGHVEVLTKKPYKSGGKWVTKSVGAGSSKTGVRHRTTRGKVPHIERVKGAR